MIKIILSCLFLIVVNLNHNTIKAAPSGNINELYPAGLDTYKGKINNKAFKHPLTTMQQSEKMDFVVGEALFEKLWTPSPASTKASDGLGPLYNARSCAQCHIGNGRGVIVSKSNQVSASLVIELSMPIQNKHLLHQKKQLQFMPEPTYGNQFQHRSTGKLDAEYSLEINYEPVPVKFADGELINLNRPLYQFKRLAYGQLHPNAMYSPRLAPQLIGLGLLEQIPDNHLLKQSDPDDKDQNGISGKPNWVWSNEYNKKMLGRFGHKAGVATINEQSQMAFVNDIGISTPLFPYPSGDCTEKQKDCLKRPNGNSPEHENLEAPSTVTHQITQYIQRLTVPKKRNTRDKNVILGQKLFTQLQCNQCHTPSHSIALAGQQEQTIWPYTDLLLHDMGEALADNRPEASANGKEWRTAPLWGIGLTKLISGDENYLHDGRAKTLMEAILWHGGEAKNQRDAVLNLSKQQRQQLIAFLRSI